MQIQHTYESVFELYKKRILQNQTDLSATQKHIYSTGSIRLVVFLGTIAAVWCFWNLSTAYIVSTVLAGVVLFLWLLKKYNRLQRKKQYLETAIQCDEEELKGLDGDFSAFDGAPEKMNAEHGFSLDLDIFGNRSLFQSINRTCTNEGKRILTEWFETPLREPKAIEIRQEIVRELRDKPHFRHHFRVLGLIHPGKATDYADLEDFVRRPDWITSPAVWKAMMWLLPCLWIAAILLTVFSLLDGQWLFYWYVVTLIISESKAKAVNVLQALAGKKTAILQAYSRLIQSVENEAVQSGKLRELQAVFIRNHQPASACLKQFAQLTNDLEQRGNLAIHILLNPLLLWDIRKAVRMEEWKQQNGNDMLFWIRVLGEWDAYNSLGTFAFNHPDAVFPSLTDRYFEMRGTALGHPLMNRQTCVRNAISIEAQPFFLIITGANMAGKSTYLRTVGVNFVLACIGAPVCAESLTLCPAKLVTSLRTSDSLNDNESYFFAELKRLKMIIDQLHAGEQLFIILDEILKGTNSIDKQKGSLALVQQLIRLQSCGIIATHDLLLGGLVQDFPDNIRNYRFEADIQNNELSFSYQLREGIAQNMNASFLMQKMGITVSRS
ncbi:MAG: DNA mismatch repair protein MutS [Candidatus Symbiothrix sp.]|jgi:hypothetical protein|nr:DNA mismatch repair protein MutS [Candidatus Symbiothrix sp.]